MSMAALQQGLTCSSSLFCQLTEQLTGDVWTRSWISTWTRSWLAIAFVDNGQEMFAWEVIKLEMGGKECGDHDDK
jgi:hypothetical protein